jgi:hypothetical protein
MTSAIFWRYECRKFAKMEINQCLENLGNLHDVPATFITFHIFLIGHNAASSSASKPSQQQPSSSSKQRSSQAIP